MLKKSILIILAAILAFLPKLVEVLLTVFHLDPISSDLQTFFSLFGPGLVFLSVLYDNSDTIYFYWNKALQFIANKETKWNLGVEFSVGVDRASVGASVEYLIERGGRRWTTQVEGEEHLAVLKMDGYVMRIKWIGDIGDPIEERRGILAFELSDLIVGFREGRRRLDRIVALFSDLERVLGPDNKKYTFSVAFLGANPYLGLLLKDLQLPSEVTAFEVDAIERFGAESSVMVQIVKEKILLTSPNLHALHESTQKYITLSSPGLARA